MPVDPKIDEDRIVILIQKTAEKAMKAKEEYQECVTLLNQLRGICKTSKGELPVSALTKKEMPVGLREVIYLECIEAASRLKIN